MIPQPEEWMFGDSVEARNALQNSGAVHPYTCGNNRTDEAHRKYAAEHGGDFGQLVAVEGGWLCPVCGYTQSLRSYGGITMTSEVRDGIKDMSQPKTLHDAEQQVIAAAIAWGECDVDDLEATCTAQLRLAVSLIDLRKFR